MRKISSKKNMQFYTTLFFIFFNFYLKKKNYFYVFTNDTFFKDI